MKHLLDWAFEHQDIVLPIVAIVSFVAGTLAFNL